MGLEWNEGPYFQSERFERYDEMVEKLLAEDKAYRCYASKELLDEIRAEQKAKKKYHVMMLNTLKSWLPIKL